MYNYTDMLLEYKNKQDIMSYINLNLTFASISDKLINLQYIDNLALNIAKTAIRLNDKDIIFNLKELCLLIPDPVSKPAALLDIISIKENNLLDIDEIITEIENCILHNPNSEASAKQYDQFVDILFSLGKIERALSFILKLKDQYLIANLYYALSMNLWNIGDTKTANSLLSKSFETSKTVEDPVNKALMLNILARIYANDYQDNELAFKIWCQALDSLQNINDEMYSSMLAIAIAKDTMCFIDNNLIEGVLQKVLTLIDTISEEGFRSNAYKEISSSLINLKNLDCIKEILDKIYSLTLNMQEKFNHCTVLPDIILLYDYIKDTNKTNEVLNRAIETIEKLSCNTYYPTAIAILVNVITKLSDAGQIDNSISKLFNFINTLDEIDSSTIYYNMAFDLSRFIDPLLSKKYLLILYTHVLKLSDSHYRKSVLSKLSLSFAMINDYDNVYMLFKDLDCLNHPPNEVYSYFTTLQNIKAIADTGQEISHNRKILEFCVSQKSCLKDPAEFCSYLTDIAASYCNINDFQHAKDLLTESIGTLKDIEFKFYLPTAVNFISSVASRISDLNIANEILDNMVQTMDNLPYNESKISAYINIAYAYREINELGKQKLMFSKAFKYIDKINDQQQMLYSISDLCNELIRLEDEEETINILEYLLQKSSIISDTYIFRRVLSCISNAASTMYSANKAWEILEKVLNSANNNILQSYSSFAITNLIEAYNHINQKDKALLLLESYVCQSNELIENTQKYHYYLNLAKAYHLLDNHKNRQEYLVKAISQIQTPLNVMNEINLYIDLAKAYLFFSDEDRYKETINKSISIANTIGDNYYFVMMMSEIAVLYANTNKQSRGKEIIASLQYRLNLVQEEDLKVVLISNISKTLALLGYKNEAKTNAEYTVSQIGKLPGDNFYCEVFSNLYIVFSNLGYYDIGFKYLEYLSLCEIEYIRAIEKSKDLINTTDHIFELLYIASKAGKSAYLLSLGLLIGSIAKIEPQKATQIIDYLANEFVK